MSLLRPSKYGIKSRVKLEFAWTFANKHSHKKRGMAVGNLWSETFCFSDHTWRGKGWSDNAITLVFSATTFATPGKAQNKGSRRYCISRANLKSKKEIKNLFWQQSIVPQRGLYRAVGKLWSETFCFSDHTWRSTGWSRNHTDIFCQPANPFATSSKTQGKDTRRQWTSGTASRANLKSKKNLFWHQSIVPREDFFRRTPLEKRQEAFLSTANTA